MSEAGIAGSIFTQLIGLNNIYLNSIYSTLMDYFCTPLRIGMLIYTLYIAYSLSTKGWEAMKSLTATYLYFLFLYSAFLEFSFFYENIVDVTIKTTMNLSSFFISAGEAKEYTNVHEVFNKLDDTAMNFFQAIQKIAPDETFITNAGKYFTYAIAAIPLFALFIGMYTAFFVIFSIAIFSMYVFFVYGGPVFFLAAFPQTRSILKTWFRGLLNYALLVITASIIMGITASNLVDAIAQFQKQATSGESIFNLAYLKILIWCGFSLATILKSPDFAAHMTGSMAGSTTGIAGALSATSGAVGGGLLTMGHKGTQKSLGILGKAGEWAHNKAWGNATDALENMRGARK
ncbi:type IV secretion system protein [Pseudodesulfovibrio senegalensis]|uniref:Type IV secretion system protein n=1 Tax=Pseudodesulfovibrio senegalensis TaxID=1721087 RepID=A0A6N6MWY1_9BACT|nr:type IV secretion system protein [Pseudodesulfovibrio senegalensis]KAB1437301.1 type IV secretion system protein [Pseudodesulfovibrio senegalensis]